MSRPLLFAIASASSRDASEDRAEVLTRGEDLVVILADGAGGLRGGATASDTIMSAMREHIDQGGDPYDVRSLSNVFRTTDAHLAKRMAGETTAIALVVGDHGITGVSSGDSEAWLVSGGRVGILTSGQTRKRLGSGKASPQPFHGANLDGILVIASDGLFKHASADAIARCCGASTVEDVVQELVRLPMLQSGRYPDDIVVVAVAQS